MKALYLISMIMALFFTISSVESKDRNIFYEAFESANKKCVKIFGGSLGDEHGYASGIVVSKDGHILTSLGMFLSSNRLKVTLADGQEYPAKIVKRNRDLQVALIKIDLECQDYFDISKVLDVQEGDWVLAVGNPFKVASGYEKMSLNLGVLSLRARLEVKRKSQDVDYRAEALLIDAITGNPGSQGGALVDIKGNLVGMIGKVLEDKGTNTRMNYGVPADLLKKFFEADGDGETEQKDIYLGIHLFMMNGLKAPAYVDRIDLVSPAFNSGVKKDDLVISVGPSRIANCEDYFRVVKDLEPREVINIVVKRGDKFISIPIRPIEKEEVIKTEEKKNYEIDLELD